MVVECLVVGVVKVFLGKVVVFDDLLYVIGFIGLFGICVSSMLMEYCDILLIVGSIFFYSEFLFKVG